VIEIRWHTDAGALLAVEPTSAELAEHAPALSAGYNDPANAALMGHTQAISPAEVVEHYTSAIAGGMRAFLLFADGLFAGDADLRNFADGACEFAFMIAAPAVQGRGLGTRFARMIHTFGFAHLGLARIYASVVPDNTASRRVFDKLGYIIDTSDAGRANAEAPGDIVLVLLRDVFLARFPAADIEIGERR
jgi:RimJ/RimL family protein N-acetyltransferase